MIKIDVHAIERENFSENGRDRRGRRFEFDPPEADIVHIRNSRGMVLADDVYCGLAATILAPEGSRIGRTSEGTAVLCLPDGRSLSAGEAIREARQGRLGIDPSATGDGD